MRVFHTVEMDIYDLPPNREASAEIEEKGWIAVSEFFYQRNLVFNGVVYQKKFNWLHKYEPVAKIGGGSIRVYYIE